MEHTMPARETTGLATPEVTEGPDAVPEFLPELPKDAPAPEDIAFSKLYGMAREQDGFDFAMMDMAMRPETDVDPDFRFDDQTWSEVTKDIPTEYLDAFYEADSLEDAQYIRRRLLRQTEIEQELAQEGWEGFSARMAAAFTDPVAYGALALTEGAAAPFVLAQKASRVQRAFRMALSGGATEGALEAFSASQKETKGVSDVLWAAAFGGILGAPFGALAKPWDADLRRASRSMADRVVAEETSEAIAHATFESTDAVRSAMANSGSFRRGRIEELKRLGRDLHNTAQARRSVEKKLKAAQGELEEISTLGDVDYIYKRFGSQIEELERQKGIEPPKAKTKDLKALRDAGENNDLNRLYRALTPERKGHIGRKEGAKIKQKIDRSLDATLKERDFRRAELEAEVPKLQAQADELKELVLGQQARLMERRSNVGPDVKLPEKAPQKASEVIGGKEPKPDPGPFDDSVGAARTAGADIEWQRADDFINEERTLTEAQELNDTPFGRARMSLSGVLQNTKAAGAQFFGREILADPVAGDTGRNLAGQQVRNERVVTKSAAEDQDMMFMQVANRFVTKAVNQAWKQHARQELGMGKIRMQFASAERDSFFTQVTDAIRSGSTEYPEPVLKAAEAVQELHETLRKVAKDANLAGFQGLDANPNYIHRIYKREKIRAANERHGDEAVIGMLEQSLLRANDEMPEEVATKVAKAIHKRFSDPGKDFDGLGFNLGFHSKDLEQLEEVLTDGTGMSREDLDFVMDYLRAEDARDGTGTDVKFAKRRIELDEMTEVDTPEGPLRFSDLTENNAELLAMRYARSMTGHIAFARKMGPLLRNEFGEDYVRHGVRTDLEMDKLMELTSRQAKGQMTDSQRKRTLDRMKMGYNMLTGRPPTAGTETDLGQAARFARDWNFVRLMGQVGAAQLAELGPIFGQVGMSLAFKNLGAFRRLWRNRDTGEFTEPMLRELEEFGYAVGVERDVFQPSYKMEDYGLESTRRDNWVQKADVGIQQLKRAVSDVSGMSGITAALQRYAAINAGQRFLKMANKGQMDTNRMRTLGLDDDMQKRVMEQLKAHQGKVTMESGRKADVLNLRNWDDPEARQAFMAAMHRWGSRMVQRNMIGEMPGWMNTVWGQLLGQFRSFVFTAYEKQLLQGLNAADQKTALTFMWSMAFGGAAYMGQTYLNSFGRDDRDRYLEERLNPYTVGLSSFQRAGFASFVPGAIDTMATGLWLDEGIFAHGRSSGLATSFIEGNPTMNLITGAGSLASSGIKAATRDDYDFSSGDMRNLFGLMAFGNTWGLRNVESMLSGGLPYKNTAEPLTIEKYLGIE